MVHTEPFNLSAVDIKSYHKFLRFFMKKKHFNLKNLILIYRLDFIYLLYRYLLFPRCSSGTSHSPHLVVTHLNRKSFYNINRPTFKNHCFLFLRREKTSGAPRRADGCFLAALFYLPLVHRVLHLLLAPQTIYFLSVPGKFLSAPVKVRNKGGGR